MPGSITTSTLWIYYEDQHEYYVYDFEAKSFSFVKGPPANCVVFPLINSLNVECSSDGHASLYNLLSGERTALAIEGADHIWQQASIPELLFYLKRDINLNEDYFSYNMSSGESKYLLTLPHGGFETLPQFSSSGDYVVAVRNDEVIKIDLGTGEYTTLFSGDERVTFDINWSPTLPVVAFGATDDLWQEIGERANLIYLLEPETGNVERLFPTEELQSYFEEGGWPIWSPKRNEFIGRAYTRLYVLNVNGEVLLIQSETSTEEAGNYRFGSIQWSPDGEYIAFIEYPNGYSKNSNLVIYSMNENQLIEVIENEGSSSVFWR
jgi:Tol biopolymer transport system component